MRLWPRSGSCSGAAVSGPVFVTTVRWLYLLAKAVQGQTDNRFCISWGWTDNSTYHWRLLVHKSIELGLLYVVSE